MNIEGFTYVEITDLKTRDFLDLASDLGYFGISTTEFGRFTVRIFSEMPGSRGSGVGSGKGLRVGFDTYSRIRNEIGENWAPTSSDVARALVSKFVLGVLSTGASADETSVEVVGASL